jgi:glycosyltransferase involved in cell wall biosynthesis
VKVLIQIPCLNEEQTLPATLADIPRSIPGVDTVEILVIDDGSTDDTVAVARAHGVDHIHSNLCNRGLGPTFATGLDLCLKYGADIIVNTDGDGQYKGGDIPRLIAPILAGSADIVVGDRQTHRNPEFSYWRKWLQWLGSKVVRSLSGTSVPDAVSGFRAISRDAAIRLNILSRFSYTVEMIIQAGNKDMTIASIPIDTNPKQRESRLFRNAPQFIAQQLVSMVRMYAMYRPMRMFFYLGTVLAIAGVIPVVRFLYFYFSGDGSGHIKSLLLGAVLLLMGFVFYVTGLLSDLISQNRRLNEIALIKIRQLELDVRAPHRDTAASDEGTGPP